jgi:hypothetical protein
MRVPNLLFAITASLFVCAVGVRAQPTPANVELDGMTISSDVMCEASSSVTAKNTTIKSGGDLTLKASNSIRLEPGFKVEKGATFSVDTDSEASNNCGVVFDVPEWMGNTRFYSDRFNVKHPSLS